jgi:predicted nucleotidyltransferase
MSLKLVGSRARGTATVTSDYDFLVFLESCDYDVEVPRLEAVGEELSSKHGLAPLSLSPMSLEQFHGLDAKYEGITGKFLRDAITLWPLD